MNTFIVAAALVLWFTVLVADVVRRDRQRRQIQQERRRIQRDYVVLLCAGKHPEAQAKLDAMDRLEAGVR